MRPGEPGGKCVVSRRCRWPRLPALPWRVSRRGQKHKGPAYLRGPINLLDVFPPCPPHDAQRRHPSAPVSPDRQRARPEVSKEPRTARAAGVFRDHPTAGRECPGYPEGRPDCGTAIQKRKNPALGRVSVLGAQLCTVRLACRKWHKSVNPFWLPHFLQPLLISPFDAELYLIDRTARAAT